MTWTRRNLLAAAAASVLAPTGRAASPKPPKNLVWLLGFGGWDTSVVVDPKPGVSDVDLAPGELVSYGALDLWMDDARPQVTSFFDAWWRDCCLIRGVDTRSIAHIDCLRRMLTGSNVRTAPDVGAIVAATHGLDRPLPYLLLGDRAFPGALASHTARLGLTNQLAAAVAGTWPGAPPALEDADEDAVRRYLAATTALQRERRAPTSADLFDAYLDSFDRAEALTGTDLGTSGAPLSFDAQLDLALQALQTGLSRSVMIDSGLDLDDHVKAYEQVGTQDALFGSLTALVDRLAGTAGVEGGDTLLDETVVVLVSEMSRTPRMNAGGGKDHWPVGALLVLGGGVPGDVVIGGTDDASVGVPVDLATGLPSEDGEALQTHHVAAALLARCGVDPDPWLPEVVGVGPLAPAP